MGEKTSWQRTPIQNLLRNGKSGKYYGRWTVSGKQKWYALETEVFSVAKLRLAVRAAEVAKLRGINAQVGSGQARMGELIAAYRAKVGANTDIRPTTKIALLGAVKRILKTWPGIAALEPKAVTPSAVLDWANRFKTEGTKFRPVGAKRHRVGNSATSVNSAIDALRAILRVAVEHGQIHANPVDLCSVKGRLKKKVTRKALTLPNRADALKLFAAMEDNGGVGGGGAEAADFCRFMATSGARISEACDMIWEYIYRDKNSMFLPGDKTESSAREVPLFEELKLLLTKIEARRESAARYRQDGRKFLGPKDHIFQIKKCQRTIDAACRRIGIVRITHHDFRHLFATACIESGVEIPTVSRWLGHKDGGVLAMKTYGHLRRDHSQAAAQKVLFGVGP